MLPGDSHATPATPAPTYAVLDGTVHTLDRRARLDFMFDGLAVTAVLALIGVGISLAARAPIGAGAAAVVAASVASLVVALAHLRWKRFTWQAEPEALRLDHGIVMRRSSFVPYHRIQQIDLVQRPVQRALGLSTLILRTAAATTDAQIPGVATAHADALRQEFLQRAGLDDAV